MHNFATSQYKTLFYLFVFSSGHHFDQMSEGSQVSESLFVSKLRILFPKSSHFVYVLFVVCPQAWHHKKIGYFRYSIYYPISLLTGQSARRVMKRIFTSVLPHISLTNLLQTWTQWYWMGKGFNEMKSEQLKPVHYIWGSWKIGFKVGNFDK